MKPRTRPSLSPVPLCRAGMLLWCLAPVLTSAASKAPSKLALVPFTWILEQVHVIILHFPSRAIVLLCVCVFFNLERFLGSTSMKCFPLANWQYYTWWCRWGRHITCERSERSRHLTRKTFMLQIFMSGRNQLLWVLSSGSEMMDQEAYFTLPQKITWKKTHLKQRERWRGLWFLINKSRGHLTWSGSFCTKSLTEVWKTPKQSQWHRWLLERPFPMSPATALCLPEASSFLEATDSSSTRCFLWGLDTRQRSRVRKNDKNSICEWRNCSFSGIWTILDIREPWKNVKKLSLL